ncbi:phage minor head protein [Mucilaginibacter gossypii]|uniref:CdiA C-terminal domain-containing protein n=1 Tax=Mucilaginibacter gossypii TaxID=551996 RepID=UPI000DCB1BAD|nr:MULTISPECIES: phage minor head protein [Mucilaginibacter]QTE36016.1 phage minor head protein [Mucilaginibacter gossypii]RAV56689.1 hypothetical protein DIU36_14910 [Mucilaginibacter rubeus]
MRAYGKKLESGVIKGYGKKLSDVDWDTPDYHTITALQNNVWQFSAAKTHTQLKDMSAALVDATGKIRSLQEFRIEARNISGQQLNWLGTEYQTAIASGQMAGKWVSIQEQKETFPFLEFDAIVDDHSSNICPPLNKVIKRVDDPFWKKYYPPNHFNCRSTVRQLRDAKETPDKDIVYPEKVGAIFQNNVGITGMVFPRDHAYYVDAPPHVINNATLYMPVKDQYITAYKSGDGTELAVNRKTAIEKAPDLEDLIKVGKVLADKGIAVDILPGIHASETDLRKVLLPGVPEGKNPDLLINGEGYADVKKPETPITFRKLQRNIANGTKQADRVIVLLDEEYDIELLKQAAADRFRALEGINEIGFVTQDGEYIEYKRPKNE